MKQKANLAILGSILLWAAIESHSQEFIISNDQFVAPGTLGLDCGRNVHGECDATGNLHIVWIRDNAIHYKKRLSGGSWTVEETVPGPSGGHWGWGARIAVSPDGEVHVLWGSSDVKKIYYAMRSASGWTSRRTLVRVVGEEFVCDPLINLQANGDVHVIFFRSSVWGRREITKTGSTWGPETPLDPWLGGTHEFVRDALGRLYLGVNGVEPVGRYYTRAAFMIWDGGWGPVYRPMDSISHWMSWVDVAPGPGSAIALSATAFNVEGDDEWFIAGIYAVTVGEAPVKLTRADKVAGTARVGEPISQIEYDLLGNQYIAWTDGDHLRYAIRRANGTWYAKDQDFPVGGGSQYYPEITTFGNTVHILWEDTRGGIYHSTIMPAPTATATDTPTGTLPTSTPANTPIPMVSVYHKDFEVSDDDLDDWAITTSNGAAEWDVVRDGGGCVDSPANWYKNAGTQGIARTYVTFLDGPGGNPIRITDGEFSYYVRGASGTNIPGVQFRRQPGTDDNGYWLQTDFRETNDDLILKVWPSGGQYPSLLGNVLSCDEWHFIRIVFSGPRIKVYCPELQSDPVIEVTDTAYSEGEVGLYHVQGVPAWAGFDEIDISSPASGTKGDMEPDGDLDLFDVLRLVDIVLEVPPPPTSHELWAGDMDADGDVDLFDILALVDKVLEA